jgi:hypothetical protein
MKMSMYSDNLFEVFLAQIYQLWIFTAVACEINIVDEVTIPSAFYKLKEMSYWLTHEKHG